MPIEALYERYQHLVPRLGHQLRRLALVLAPMKLSFVVLGSGLLGVAGSLGITFGINQVAQGQGSAEYLILFLALAFLAESFGYWVKERQEMLLSVAVRQITYRRFRSIFARKPATADDRGKVLTYPAQISQFAYIVDFAVSTLQIIAFLAISLLLYGFGGAIAAVLITALVFLSIRLVHLIGHVWEKYIALEGERRSWIQRVADSLPRGASIPSWAGGLDRIAALRADEEKLLRRRVPLQVLNGFVEKGALVLILAVVALVSVWFWPGASFGLGILLATRYIYAAVQNNIVNYRVIRLAIPMLRDLENLEADLNRNTDHCVVTADLKITDAVQVLPRTSEQAETLRQNVGMISGSAWVPQDPHLAQSVVTAWRDEAASDTQKARLTALALEMGLSHDVLERLWTDTSTLSSGERHRAALALVLTNNPTWLVLDNTFAALDPALREKVARVIVRSVPRCTLLTESHEYVPRLFTSQGISEDTHDDAESRVSRVHDTADTAETDLPDPAIKGARFWSTTRLLFGFLTVPMVVGALLLSISEVVAALALSHSDAVNADVAGILAVCAVAMILGSVLFFGVIYGAPISRLGALHARLMKRIDRFASARTSGAVVGRLGEDFSNLQMSIPSALGSAYLVVFQTILLVSVSAAGAPLFIVVVLVVLPVAFGVMRLGARWILPASTAVSNDRGEFLGAVAVQAGTNTMPMSASLRLAGEAAYRRSESTYMRSAVRVANAYAFRSGMIQLLVLLLNISAVLAVLLLGDLESWVAPAAVIYFAMTLSSGVRSTVETLQEVGVVGLTAERVQILEGFRANHALPAVQASSLQELEGILNSGCPLVAVIGPSGVGKSVALDALSRRFLDAALVPEVDPFAPQDREGSGIRLLHSVLGDESVRLVLLDETLKGLSAADERAELEHLRDTLAGSGRQAVVVLHSRLNLECFDRVVDFGP